MLRVIVSVSNNPVGAHIVWNFFKANWHVFFERLVNEHDTRLDLIE